MTNHEPKHPPADMAGLDGLRPAVEVAQEAGEEWERYGPHSAAAVIEADRAEAATQLQALAARVKVLEAENERLREAAFADGFSAALQGAEAVIWAVEDDAFLYPTVSGALQEVIAELQEMEGNWTKRSSVDHRSAVQHEARLAEREAENERLRRDHAALAKQLGIAERKLKSVTKLWHTDRGALVDVAASLAAAISLLERGGKAAKKAAPSDLMFDQMVRDYTASLERARAALEKKQ